MADAERDRARATRAVLAAVAVGALAVAGCGPKQRGEPAGPPVRLDTAAEARGRVLFQHACYACHPGGEGGLGPALNDKPLPAFAIRTQIRKGVGAMPAFSDEMLADGEVDAIVAYVEALRAAPASYSRR